MQLAFACQQSMIRVQHRRRHTMQHVFGHRGNLENECAAHTAAFGTFGLISIHNTSTRWVGHNFDTWVRRNFDNFVCFDGCHSISETLERLQDIRTNTAALHQNRVQHWFFSSCSLCPVCCFCVLMSCVSLALSSFVFAFSGSLLSQQVMDRLSSSTSNASNVDDYFEHIVWNLVLELLFFEHVNGIVESYLEDLDLGKIAFSCHFALDLLCYKAVPCNLLNTRRW